MVSVQQLAGWSSGTRPIGLSRVALAVPKTCMIIYHVTGSCIMLHGHVLSYMVMCHCTCSCFSPHPCRVPLGGIHVGLPPCKRSCQKFCPVSPWSPQRNTRSYTMFEDDVGRTPILTIPSETHVYVRRNKYPSLLFSGTGTWDSP